MAILTFGSTFRNANQGVAFLNTASYNVIIPLLGLNIKAGATETVHLNVFDAYYRNPRHEQVYNVDTKGKPFKDDVTDLAALISAGTLLVKAATYSSNTNTFTVGTTATPTSLADGSVTFA